MSRWAVKEYSNTGGVNYVTISLKRPTRSLATKTASVALPTCLWVLGLSLCVRMHIMLFACAICISLYWVVNRFYDSRIDIVIGVGLVVKDSWLFF